MAQKSGVFITAKINKSLLTKLSKEQSKRIAGSIAAQTMAISIATSPYDTGDLSASHSRKDTGKSYVVTNSQDYAPIVHAMPQSRIKKGKRAQWLSRALQEACKAHGLVLQNKGKTL